MGGAIVSHGQGRDSASGWGRVGRPMAVDSARRAAATLGVAVLLAACTGAPGTASGSQVPTTALSGSATPTNGTQFASFRVPYRLDLPVGWTVLASSQQPGSDEDVFVAPDRATWVTMGTGQPLPGQTVKDRVNLGRLEFPQCESRPTDDRSISMGGEPGLEWSYACLQDLNLAAQSIHQGLGYRLTVHVCTSATALAQPQMDGLLAGFAFTDGPAAAPASGVATSDEPVGCGSGPSQSAAPLPQTNLDGVWQACPTEKDILAAGGGADNARDNAGCSTLTFRHGAFLESGASASTGQPGTYRIADGEVTIFRANGEAFDFAWSVSGDSLTLKRSTTPGAISPEVWIAKPFTRQGP
jgi:hypothetical protein